MKIYRIAIVGLGRQGKEHFAACQILANEGVIEIVGVCDEDKGFLQNLSKKTGINSFSDYKDLLGVKPDLVIIAVPNNLHFEICRYFLNFGIAVLKEKPMSINFCDAEQLNIISEKNNVILYISQQRFFNDYFKKIKNNLDNRIGKVYLYDYVFTLNDTRNSWYRDKSNGGGSWYGLGSHTCSLVNYLFGIPKSVTANFFTSNLRTFKYDTDDTNIISLTHGAGMLGRIYTSVVSPIKQETLFIQGERGCVYLSREKLIVTDLLGTNVINDIISHNRSKSYIDQIQFVLKNINNPQISQYNLDVMKLIDGCITSNDCKKNIEIR